MGQAADDDSVHGDGGGNNRRAHQPPSRTVVTADSPAGRVGQRGVVVRERDARGGGSAFLCRRASVFRPDPSVGTSFSATLHAKL